MASLDYNARVHWFFKVHENNAQVHRDHAMLDVCQTLLQDVGDEVYKSKLRAERKALALLILMESDDE